jgi:hypothetical protein
MGESRIKYFPVVPNLEKPRFNRQFVFLNARAYTDKDTGEHVPESCPPALTPGSLGIYKVDLDEEHGDKKLKRMLGVVAKGIYPVIGPFDSVKDALAAAWKIHPLSNAEKLAQADANLKELETLRAEKAKGKNKFE